MICKNLWCYFSVLWVLTACGEQQHSRQLASHDNANNLDIELMMVRNEKDGNPIDKNYEKTFPFLKISSPDPMVTKAFGIPILCEGNYSKIFPALGYSADTKLTLLQKIDIDSPKFVELGIAKHTPIRCRSGEIDQEGMVLFRQKRQDNESKGNFYLKFKDSPNSDATNLYELKCEKNLELIHNSMARVVSLPSAKDLPNLPRKYLLGGAIDGPNSGTNGGRARTVNIWPLTCGSVSVAQIGPIDYEPSNYQFIPFFDNINRVALNKSQLYLVSNDGNDPRMGDVDAYYMIVSKGKGFPVGCGAESGSLISAIGLNENSAVEIDESDLIYQKSQPSRQPVLGCSRTDIDRVFHVQTVDSGSDITYVRFTKYPAQLFKLGCNGLKNLYSTSNFQGAISTTESSLAYMVDHSELKEGMSLISDVSCHIPFPGDDKLRATWLDQTGAGANDQDVERVRSYIKNNWENWEDLEKEAVRRIVTTEEVAQIVNRAIEAKFGVNSGAYLNSFRWYSWFWDEFKAEGFPAVHDKVRNLPFSLTYYGSSVSFEPSAARMKSGNLNLEEIYMYYVPTGAGSFTIRPRSATSEQCLTKNQSNEITIQNCTDDYYTQWFTIEFPQAGADRSVRIKTVFLEDCLDMVNKSFWGYALDNEPLKLQSCSADRDAYQRFTFDWKK